MLRPAAGAVPPFMALVEPLERVALSEAVRKRAQNDVHNLAIVYGVRRG